jgi:hypothetical protein
MSPQLVSGFNGDALTVEFELVCLRMSEEVRRQIELGGVSRGLGSNGTEKALKPLRACFVLASSPRLAAQARHFRRTYCDCRPAPQFLQNANDRWETAISAHPLEKFRTPISARNS